MRGGLEPAGADGGRDGEGGEGEEELCGTLEGEGAAGPGGVPDELRQRASLPLEECQQEQPEDRQRDPEERVDAEGGDSAMAGRSGAGDGHRRREENAGPEL